MKYARNMSKERDIERTRDLILRSLQGTLPEEERRELDAWREASPRNEAVYRKLAGQQFTEEEWELFRQVRQADDWARLWCRIRGHRRFLTWRWMVRYAAVLVVGLAALYLWQQPETKMETVPMARQEVQPGSWKAVLELESGEQIALGTAAATPDERLVARGIADGDSAIVYREQPLREVEYHTLRVPRGGEYVLTLADSTRVWVNSETVLRYPNYFAGDERRVEVTGEAYFEVAKDAAKPFIVEAGGVSVRVTGTEFNVMAYGNGNRVETTLVAGGVDVTAGEDTLSIRPGMQAVFEKEGGRLSAREVNTASYTSWKEGIFDFSDLPLREIADQLERWYDVDVTFADPAAADIHFTGAVKKAKPLEFILDIIRTTRSIDFRVDGQHVVIWMKQ